MRFLLGIPNGSRVIQWAMRRVVVAKGLGWCVLALSAAACGPGGSMKTLVPVKQKIGAYSSVMVRATAAPANEAEAQQIENIAAYRIRTLCGYPTVLTYRVSPQTPAELLVDLRIGSVERVGSGERAALGGLAGQARVALALDLIEVTSGSRVGAVQIEGLSSGGSAFAGTTEEAIEQTVNRVQRFLADSGCQVHPPGYAAAGPVTGPDAPGGNVAPPGTQAPAGAGPALQAEGLNQEGKDLYKAKSYAAAAEKFRAAASLVPDARYDLNLCLALKATKDWPGATTACERAAQASSPELATKAKEHLAEIQKLKGG